MLLYQIYMTVLSGMWDDRIAAWDLCNITYIYIETQQAVIYIKLLVNWIWI